MPPLILVNECLSEYDDKFKEVKMLHCHDGREADHLSSSNAEVKSGGAIPPFPPYVFMA
jgi:hypothetical protein